MRNLLLALILIAFVSCRTAKYIPPVQPGITTSSATGSSVTSGGETLAGYIKPDSAGIKALLVCDSLGHVYIRQITELQTGQHVKPGVQIKDNYIYVKCEVDSMQVYSKWQRFYNKETDTASTIKYLPGEVTNRLTWTQGLLIKCGWVFIVSCVLAIIYLILKFKTPLKLT